MHSHIRSITGHMVHPCDGEAWQQFDEGYKDVGADPGNVCLRIATV
jgi:hypothetical protein